MGGKSSPKAPDYKGAANTQGNADIQTALLNNIMGNPNRVNSDGSSSTYSQTGMYRVPKIGDRPAFDIPIYTLMEMLSPQNQRINEGLGNVAEQGLGYVQNALNRPFDQNALPASMLNAGETGQEAIMRRLQPQIEKNRGFLEQNLANKGISMGSQAWQNALMQQGQQENDLYSQAALQGIDLGQQARQQAIQEQNFFRNEPLNMLNAVRSGQQIVNPQFSQFNSAQASSPNLYGAAQNQYQAQLAQANAQNAGQAGLLNGLVGLGSAAMMSPVGTFSDERLKSNIERVGTHPLGVGIYEYDIFGRRERGVMAQELIDVLPEAVIEDESGFLKVNYALL